MYIEIVGCNLTAIEFSNMIGMGISFIFVYMGVLLLCS